MTSSFPVAVGTAPADRPGPVRGGDGGVGHDDHDLDLTADVTGKPVEMDRACLRFILSSSGRPALTLGLVPDRLRSDTSAAGHLMSFPGRTPRMRIFPLASYAFVLVVGLVVGAQFVRTDRRRLLRKGRYPGPPWGGRCAWTVTVELSCSPDDAATATLRALRQKSHSEVTAVAPWTWVGWTGLSWRSWGQETSVVVTTTGPGLFRLDCSSRPRFGTTLIDWGASERAAKTLAAEVQGDSVC